MARRSMNPAASSRSLRLVGERPAGEAVEDGQRDVLAHVEEQDEALALAVLGEEGDAVVDGVVRAADADRLAVDADARRRPRDRRRRWRARPPCGRRPPVRPGPTTSPARAEKLMSSNTPCRVRPSTRRISAPGGTGFLGACSASSRPTMSAMSSVLRDARGGPRGDVLAVAQDRDAVRELEGLVQVVADEDRGDAVRLELAHDLEEVVDLAQAQRGRGLVHDDDVGLVEQGLGDLDHLLLADAQSTHGRARVDVEVQTGQQLARTRVHGPPVQEGSLRTARCPGTCSP